MKAIIILCLLFPVFSYGRIDVLSYKERQSYKDLVIARTNFKKTTVGKNYFEANENYFTDLSKLLKVVIVYLKSSSLDAIRFSKGKKEHERLFERVKAASAVFDRALIELENSKEGVAYSKALKNVLADVKDIKVEVLIKDPILNPLGVNLTNSLQDALESLGFEKRM